jgi:ribosomal protein S18 acetylase RimI-like enzyme
MNTRVRPIRLDDHESILEVAQALHPGWFNELGLEEIARDLQNEQGLVAVDNGKIVGFVIHRKREDGVSAELSWIAVRPELHRKGIGRSLVNALVDDLTQQGFRTLEVSTVAPTVEYEPYARTRSFYHDVGFSDVQIDKNFFPSGDDRLLLRKHLAGV